MKRFRFWCTVALGLIGSPAAFPAIPDVPPDSLVWLQGYDLNPVTPAFRNQGTVKLECVDDALPIHLTVQSPGLENSAQGLLLFAAGAGGSRVFSGSLANAGVVRLAYAAAFVGQGSRIDNRAEFLVDPGASARFLGPDLEFLQTEGRLVTGTAFQLEDASFRYLGGDLQGSLELLRSHLEVAPSRTNAFTATFLGPSSSFVGRIAPRQLLKIAGSARGGAATVSFPQSVTVNGDLILSSLNIPSAAHLLAPAGLVIPQDGRLLIEPGAGGSRSLHGPIQLDGRLSVRAPFSLVSPDDLLVRGTLFIGQSGVLNLENSARVLSPGHLELEGGTLTTPGHVELADGDLVGFGTLDADLLQRAVIHHLTGEPPWTITGSLHQEANARLRLQVDESPDPHSEPALIVRGIATLNGVLEVTADPAYQPRIGDRLPLVAAREFRGSFQQILLPSAPADAHWSLHQTLGTIVAVLEPGPPAPRFSAQRTPDGRLRIEVHGAGTSPLHVELSPDLHRWDPLTARLEFDQGRIWMGGPLQPDTGPALFFRPALADGSVNR